MHLSVGLKWLMHMLVFVCVGKCETVDVCVFLGCMCLWLRNGGCVFCSVGVAVGCEKIPVV